MPSDNRRGPFSRLYGPWLDRLAGTGAGRAQTLVLLCLCERLEFDKHGNATAWYPRAELAERLEVTEDSVSKAVSGLIEKRLISVKRTGHKGRTTVYNVFPGIPWPSQRCHGEGHQKAQRYPQTGCVGTTHRDTPKTYIGGGSEPSPYKTVLQQLKEDLASGKALTRENW
ncbi:hypothetical protein B5F79_08645 [Olsenella sp. An285]|uniref:MarR family transcriptional regulator n=1 Tax=Olsenella sp. An285 TaxID=1965621 RepID=UPI000B3AE689|nr:helix-turn-helix domain-containing protein [Olsenella sp. An285]OUO46005.1 hypothetical protein B5F79_08645 [Olsenella sp. An285]